MIHYQNVFLHTLDQRAGPLELEWRSVALCSTAGGEVIGAGGITFHSSSPGAGVISTGRLPLSQPMSTRLCVGDRTRLSHSRILFLDRPPIGRARWSKARDPPVFSPKWGRRFPFTRAERKNGRKRTSTTPGFGREKESLSCYTGINILYQARITAVFTGAPFTVRSALLFVL